MSLSFRAGELLTTVIVTVVLGPRVPLAPLRRAVALQPAKALRHG